MKKKLWYHNVKQTIQKDLLRHINVLGQTNSTDVKVIFAIL